MNVLEQSKAERDKIQSTKELALFEANQEVVNKLAGTQKGLEYLRWVYSISKMEIDFSNTNITISRDSIVYSEANRRMYHKVYRQYFSNETLILVERQG